MMQETGFHVWTFFILRATSYGSREHDRRWESFLSTMRADTEHILTQSQPKPSEYQDNFPLLKPLVRWDALEDKARLERASVEQAEKVFIEWWQGVCVERDDDGGDHLFIHFAVMPRFRYFVMVTDESLSWLPEVEGEGEARQTQLGGLRPIKVRVVDAGVPENRAEICARARWRYSSSTPTKAKIQWAWENGRPGEDDVIERGSEYSDEEDDGDSGSDHDPVEGCRDWNVGWMWVETCSLLGFYDTLHCDSGWDLFYERPPKVYPRYYNQNDPESWSKITRPSVLVG